MADSKVNLAGWQDVAKGPIVVKEAPFPEPAEGEVRIKVYAASVQPVDGKQFAAGIMPNFKFPGILGAQAAGIVDAVGTNVTRVKVGDRVTSGLSNFALGGDPSRSGFARYTLAPERESVKIGDKVDFADAVSVGTQTPPAALFRTLGLSRPDVEPPQKQAPRGEKVLIWGGSTASGALSISYAKLAGYEVITTSSPSNFDLVRKLGADHVFDRNSAKTVEDIKALLPIRFWFDTASLPDSFEKIIEIAKHQHESDGQDIGLITLLPASKAMNPATPEFPAWLKPQLHLFRNKLPENADHMEWSIGTKTQPGFIEKAVKGGWIEGVPSRIVGGLDKLEEALQQMYEMKNSAVKLVIAPWEEVKTGPK